MKMESVRDVIFWEYAKLISGSAIGNLSKGDKDPYEWHGRDRRNEIPRIVVGKYLKMAYTRHEANGTLESPGSGSDGQVHLSDLIAVFESQVPKQRP